MWCTKILHRCHERRRSSGGSGAVRFASAGAGRTPARATTNSAKICRAATQSSGTFEEGRERLPIPQSEVDLNPNVEQNEEY